jgi:ganglioside-induced differentiation-associated protein 1
MFELYHHGSSVCAAKVRLALAEKGLDWTSHYLDILKGEQFAPAYLAINPKAVVPTLVHDGRIIPESTVICEYLEDACHGPKLFYKDPFERAQLRVWTKAVDEDLHPACSAITYTVSHRHTIMRNGVQSHAEFLAGGGGEPMEARKLKWQWLQHGLEAPGAADKIKLYDAYLHKMENSLAGRRWLVGDEFSIADVALTPYVNRLAMLAMEPMWTGGRLPNVERWFADVRARPSFGPALVKWMPPSLAADLRTNGESSWPVVSAILGLTR